MIELLACSLGRNDETPNIELAEKLCSSEDKNGILEIVNGLNSEDPAVTNDCIKVLYEVGNRNPSLISDYADVFIDSLSSKNNRLVWGCMTALASVVSVNPNPIYHRLPELIKAYENGSVITIDNSVSVFAWLCEANKKYQSVVFPILINHLTKCRAKEIPQHAERMAVCIDSENKDLFIKALYAREIELTDSQKNRLSKLVKKIQT